MVRLEGGAGEFDRYLNGHMKGRGQGISNGV